MSSAAMHAPAARQSTWLGRRLADDRFLWRTAAVVFGVIAFGKGMRRPNLWAATQAQVDYAHGLVKRGLFGTTLGHWFHLQQYSRFAVISFVLLALLMALLVWLTARCHGLSRLGAGEPVAMFFSSFAVTFLAHLVGYLDIPLAILAVLLLLIRDTRIRFAAAIPLCLGALLIHELFLFAFLPVVLFSFLIDGLRSTATPQRRMVTVMGAVLVLLCGVAALRLALDRPMTDEQAHALQAEIAAHADFPVRIDFFEVLERSGADNLKKIADMFLHTRQQPLRFAEAAVVFLPAVLMLMIAGRSAVHALFAGRSRRMALAAALIATLSPLLLLLIGWDDARWDALVCVEAFLVLLVLARELPEAGLALPAGYRGAAVLVLALSMATGESLMDREVVNQYPFTMSVKDFAKAARHHHWGVPEH